MARKRGGLFGFLRGDKAEEESDWQDNSGDFQSDGAPLGGKDISGRDLSSEILRAFRSADGSEAPPPPRTATRKIGGIPLVPHAERTLRSLSPPNSEEEVRERLEAARCRANGAPDGRVSDAVAAAVADPAWYAFIADAQGKWCQFVDMRAASDSRTLDEELAQFTPELESFAKERYPALLPPQQRDLDVFHAGLNLALTNAGAVADEPMAEAMQRYLWRKKAALIEFPALSPQN